jgi:hypothetical protein
MDPEIAMDFYFLNDNDSITFSVRTKSPPDIVPEDGKVPKPYGMPGEWEFLFGLTWQVTIKKSEYPALSKDSRILSIRRISK